MALLTPQKFIWCNNDGFSALNILTWQWNGHGADIRVVYWIFLFDRRHINKSLRFWTSHGTGVPYRGRCVCAFRFPGFGTLMLSAEELRAAKIICMSRDLPCGKGLCGIRWVTGKRKKIVSVGGSLFYAFLLDACEIFVEIVTFC